jgi:hypothetical protein
VAPDSLYRAVVAIAGNDVASHHQKDIAARRAQAAQAIVRRKLQRSELNAHVYSNRTRQDGSAEIQDLAAMVVGLDCSDALYACPRRKQEIDTDTDADWPTSTESGHL